MKLKLLRLAPENTKFGFMRLRRMSYPFSAILSILSVVMFFTVGMNFGIDFSGGTMFTLRAKSGTADLAVLRDIGNKLGLGAVEVQGLGTLADVSVRVRVQPGGDAVQTAAVDKVKTALGTDYDFRDVEEVGPTVSGELVQSGTLGVCLSILAVLTYLWFRFEW
jgi:preprotein translocase subunit SecF